jgi:hypothetical protein
MEADLLEEKEIARTTELREINRRGTQANMSAVNKTL